ncbi:hypothetical protein DV702_09870 [Sporosarcina sp. PTS2304]|uniref:CHY zinc finger protein n=1 Tax=Sporosarcina sp. PTS2304 TaxID=2283194 RepID=UPI000E0D75EF|nr:CHY zinc finger protein [Sporosarcina sp. PTS2304]AXI00002.1 hypothetical protein DV702_09870 [Sporosarcina sp. PTS2304]
MKNHLQKISGSLLDDETRCVHYNGENDRVAIKFYCCKTYYPCYACHEEGDCQLYAVWPVEQFDEKAILCGSCRHELTINEYFQCGYVCPSCESSFNPNCALHKYLYFEH